MLTGQKWRIAFSRAETAETKLKQMKPKLAKTSDRAYVLEESHRII
jgi:hypothetical protein